MRNFGKYTVIRGQEKFCDFRSVRRMEMSVYQCRDCGGTVEGLAGNVLRIGARK